jgi:hypothetical protein
MSWAVGMSCNNSDNTLLPAKLTMRCFLLSYLLLSYLLLSNSLSGGSGAFATEPGARGGGLDPPGLHSCC